MQHVKIHEVELVKTGNFMLKGRSIETVFNTVMLEIMQCSSETELRYEGLILNQEFFSSTRIILHRYYQ